MPKLPPTGPLRTKRRFLRQLSTPSPRIVLSHTKPRARATTRRPQVSAFSAVLVGGLLSGAVSVFTTYATLSGQLDAQRQTYGYQRETEQRSMRNRAYLEFIDAMDAFYVDIGVYRACAQANPAPTICDDANQSLATKTVALEAARRQIVAIGSDDAIQLISQESPDTEDAVAIRTLQDRIVQMKARLQDELLGTSRPGTTGHPGRGPQYTQVQLELQVLTKKLEQKKTRLDESAKGDPDALRRQFLALVCKEGPAPRSSC